jgi:hypothetical protein
MNHGTKFCRLCLKLLLPTILTSSLPFYPYQKDERALPGYLLTICSFSSSDLKLLSLSPSCFLFSSILILSFLTLSLSLSLQLYKGYRGSSLYSWDIVLRNNRCYCTSPVIPDIVTIMWKERLHQITFILLQSKNQAAACSDLMYRSIHLFPCRPTSFCHRFYSLHLVK